MSRPTTRLSALFAAGAVSFLAGCGPGPYGFARYYVPSDDEVGWHERSGEYPYAAVNADPDEFQDRIVAWFGIVESVSDAGDGRQKIRLSHQEHKERHLCEGETDDTCRVTVNFKSSGGFTVYIVVRPEDLVPSLDKLQPGSLMRVFGKVRCQLNDEEQTECAYDEAGGIVLDGQWYRQWPARYFVTTRAAGSMRR